MLFAVVYFEGSTLKGVSELGTLERPVKPSFTFGMTRMWMGPWGLMSLNSKTCIIMQNDLRKHAIGTVILKSYKGFKYLVIS